MTATTASARSDLTEVGRSEATLRTFLHGLPGVDQVGAEQRAAMLGTRSIKTTAKAWAIDLAIRMVDLTTLEGADTPGKVRALAAKALRPDPADPSCPPVAAVCVYPTMVPVAAEALWGTGTGPGRPNGAVPRLGLLGEPADGRGPQDAATAGDTSPTADDASPTADGTSSAADGTSQPGSGASPAAPAGGRGRVHLASVATAFPSGQAPLEVRLADTRSAVAGGADEIDMVINRGAFLSGRYREVYDEIVAVKAACGDAHLKVILETGELVTYDNVRRASWLAMLAGADFIKTSTGKVPVAATLPVTLVMLEAVRDFRDVTGRQVGVKPAGGIRTTKDAIKYLVLVNETAGPDWLHPDWFRFGASSLLNDLLMQRTKLSTGVYSGPDYFTLD